MFWLCVKDKYILKSDICVKFYTTFSNVKFKRTCRRKTHWFHRTVFQNKLFTVGVFDGMTPCYYVKCYLREQFLILSTNSVSPMLAFLFQRIGATYQYSPLEVKKPNRTTIVVVTAAIRGPSIFSLYVIRSLHNKNVQIKKKGNTEQIHCSHSVFPSLLFHHPKKVVVGGNSIWPIHSSPSCCRSQSSLL